MKYATPEAFRAALDQRIRNEAAASGVPVMRLRKRVAFERFLARLAVVEPKRWVDHEGRLALPSTPARWPAEWPPATPGPDSSRGFTAFMAEQKPEILARQEAVTAATARDEHEHRRAPASTFRHCAA